LVIGGVDDEGWLVVLIYFECVKVINVCCDFYVSVFVLLDDFGDVWV